uniref:Uncharacterized protein n=1 Tax=Salix viminalis TaxID=40686 RepID=A0A6N2LNN8_SALVM
MMFLDGCFILQVLFNKLKKQKLRNEEVTSITRDLFLLENQLPFQVLIPLMRSKDTVYELDFYHHLLDFFYFKFVYGEGHHQRESRSNREATSWYRYYSVNELKKVGISFAPRNASVFVDVKFRNPFLGGTLRIPPLNIEDSTKSLLLNLAAYEACAGWSSAKCTSYVCFMRSLIDKPEDVKELRWMGILRTTIGPDNQIAQIFKEMTINLVPNPSAYRDVKNSVESHYRSTFRRFIFHYKGRISEAMVKYSFIYGIAVSAIQAYMAQTKQRPDYGICSCSNTTLLHH